MPQPIFNKQIILLYFYISRKYAVKFLTANFINRKRYNNILHAENCQRSMWYLVWAIYQTVSRLKGQSNENRIFCWIVIWVRFYLLLSAIDSTTNSEDWRKIRPKIEDTFELQSTIGMCCCETKSQLKWELRGSKVTAADSKPKRKQSVILDCCFNYVLSNWY